MPARKTLRPGSVAFNLVMSVTMGMTALAIDSMLPAFDEIRADLGLAEGSADVAVLVTAFMLGFGLGQLPAGLLADRFGRRPVLWGGLATYIVGALATAVAPSLFAMAAARFLWGLGAAGPRVAVTAMVRDSFEGEQMAKQMSTIMAVFLIIPMLAPTMGAGAVALGPWQLVTYMCAAIAVVVFAISFRLPATLPPEQRRSLSMSDMLASWKVVLSAPGVVAYMAAVTFATAVFLSYLASSENVIETVFDLGDWFPLIFGCMAVGLSAGAIFNGRFVEALGLNRMLLGSSSVFIGASVVMTLISLGTEGTPPFWLFAPGMLAALMAGQMTMINANSAAMVPLGGVAGSGAALLGMVPMVCGSLMGAVIDAQFDGTVTPLSLAFVAGSILTFVTLRAARRASAEQLALAAL